MMGLALLIVSGVASAGTKAGKLTRNYAINTYVDAMVRGRLDGFKDVLAPDAGFSMLRGTKVMNFNKKQMLDYMEDNRNVEQVCDISTEVIESNSDISLVKMDMKFDGFTRSNYVTIANTGEGWKITNVYSVFK